MGLKERFLFYLEAKGLSGNLRAVERTIGLSNGAIDKLSDATRKSTINRISIAFPDLNTDWLLTGLGDIRAGQEDPNLDAEIDAVVQKMVSEGQSIGGSVPYEFVQQLFRERETHDQIMLSQQKTIDRLTELLQENKKTSSVPGKDATFAAVSGSGLSKK